MLAHMLLIHNNYISNMSQKDHNKAVRCQYKNHGLQQYEPDTHSKHPLRSTILSQNQVTANYIMPSVIIRNHPQTGFAECHYHHVAMDKTNSLLSVQGPPATIAVVAVCSKD